MWNFDKIQQLHYINSLKFCCGLMWNFDKIQQLANKSYKSIRCGLMWNFDKIQQSQYSKSPYTVVV